MVQLSLPGECFGIFQLKFQQIIMCIFLAFSSLHFSLVDIVGVKVDMIGDWLRLSDAGLDTSLI